MLETDNERPGVEETYQTAGNTSNLTVEADRKGSADVLIAAGWSLSRVGMALLRLHSEWDAAAKPRRVTPEIIEAIVVTIKAEDVQAQRDADRKGEPFKPRGPAITRANERAQAWYTAELRLLAQSLKSRPIVWEHLGGWLALKGISAEVGAAALEHWLSPGCPVCSGHGLRKVPGQPALSARQCHKCYGTGHRPPPDGASRVIGYMDDCVSAARQSLKKRLRNG